MPRLREPGGRNHPAVRPFTEKGAAIAAMNWRRLLGVVGNIHLDSPASLAIEFVV